MISAAGASSGGHIDSASKESGSSCNPERSCGGLALPLVVELESLLPVRPSQAQNDLPQVCTGRSSLRQSERVVVYLMIDVPFSDDIQWCTRISAMHRALQWSASLRGRGGVYKCTDSTRRQCRLVCRPSITAVFGGRTVAFDLSNPADVAAWTG
jgi:hypothetical protein